MLFIVEAQYLNPLTNHSAGATQPALHEGTQSLVWLHGGLHTQVR